MGKGLSDTSSAVAAVDFVARQIGRQQKVIALQLDSVSDGGDIEAVHRCRVASRRLRVALAILGNSWDGKQVKRWKNDLRRLTRDLGEARDHDVQIETLLTVLAGEIDKPAVLGVALLLAELTAERFWLQHRVAAAVARFTKSGVLSEIRRVRAGKKPSGQASVAHIRKRLGKRVAKQYAALQANADALAKPADFERHHAMRISAKRLRYALEIVRGMFAVDVETPIAEAKKAQSLLGEVHDCDVWLQRLDEFVAKEQIRERAGHASRGHGERLRPGVDNLRARFKEQRRQAFDAFVELWKQWQEDRVWHALLEELEQSATHSRAARNGAIKRS